MPESRKDYGNSMHTRWAQVKLAAGKQDAQRTTQAGGSEEPYVAPLRHHLRERLTLTRAEVEPVNMDVLLDFGAGVTGISEDICQKLQYKWSGEELESRTLVA